jgi:rhamnose utilization protein RhaD (predicted bifunctional aldolase and dehydrogenase)
MPDIRGRISKGEHKAGHFTDAPEVLEFVNSKQLAHWRRLAHPARPFPAHQDQAADRAA